MLPALVSAAVVLLFPPPVYAQNTVVLGKKLNSSSQNALKGVVEMHAHPMAHLGFGGKVVHGGPYIGALMLPGTIWNGQGCNQQRTRASNIAEALGTCYATHGGHDLLKNTCGNEIRHAVIAIIEKQSSNEGPPCSPYSWGYPGFAGWPKRHLVTHQQMWVDWIKRAYDGGLRVLVALAVNSKTLAQACDGVGPYDDKSTAELQIRETINLVEKHPWMEIARSPADLRRIVGERDHLAIVLGAELDDIGAFNDYNDRENTVTYKLIREEIRDLHRRGVRYIFPLHLTDNLFGGTAVYQDLFNLANRNQWGEYWNLISAEEEAGTTDVRYRFANNEQALNAFRHVVPLNVVPPVPPVSVKGHINKRDLKRKGAAAVREMMRLGMMVDIDHCSYRTAEDVLDLAREFTYPINSGHNSLRRLKEGAEKTEYQRTASQYERIRDSGGMVGVGWAKSDQKVFLKDFLAVKGIMGGRAGIGLGTDANGLSSAPRIALDQPGRVAEISQALYRDDFVKSRAPELDMNLIKEPVYPRTIPYATSPREWDVVSDGVAHYGLIPDFLRYIELNETDGKSVVDELYAGAGHFARMWELSERQAHEVGPDPWGRVGDACNGNSQCDSGYCDRGMGSGNTNKCVQFNGDSGEYCSLDRHCKSALYCVGSKCTGKKELGARCPTGNRECESGSCDAGLGSGNTNRCVRLDGDSGEYCSLDRHCKSALYCVSSKCKAKKEVGDRCPKGNKECESGFCDAGLGTGGTVRCVPAAGRGRHDNYCSQHAHCSSNNCDDRRCR
jgi:microsomal dipeptidase-like Zn-dependent dipeptidase